MILKNNFKILNLLFLFFLLMGLFPLIPFHLKSMLLVLALLIGIFIFIKTRKIEFSRAYFYNCLLFVPFLTSLIYSENFNYGLQKIITMSSLVLIPFFFLLISKLNENVKYIIKYEKLFFYTFYLSSIIYCFLLFFYIYNIGFFNDTPNYDLTISYIVNEFWFFNEHPIYISIFLSVSILFSIKVFFDSANNNIKRVIIISNLLIIIVILFLSRKGVIISLFFSTFYLLIINIKKKYRLNKNLIIIILTSLISFLFIFSFVPSRMHELFNSNSYTNSLTLTNSTSIRLAVYKCALKNTNGAGFFGYGIGDVKGIMDDCYEKTSIILVNGKYNTHNEYLNYWLASGLFGIFIFLFSLIKIYKFSLSKRDYLFTSIIIFYTIEMLTENILDRQNGVILFSFLVNFLTFKNITTPIQKKI